MKKVIRTDIIDFQYENDVEICGKRIRSFIIALFHLSLLISVSWSEE